MYLRFTLLLVAALAILADASEISRFRPLVPGELDMSILLNSPPLGVFVWVVQQVDSKPSQMGEQSKLAIIRFVDGEFAKATQPLPHEKAGYKIPVGKPLDLKGLQAEVRREGAIASAGDTVQITSLEFREKEIAVQINGGGKKKFHLRDHLQIGTNVPPPSSTDTHPDEGRGTTIILDYGRPLPDLSPDDVKRDLSVLLDFSKERSAAVNWIDTLSPEIRQAIEDHRALVGMDQEMVIAALGRADHKVRERDADGKETEDWIYGTPPAKTTFVTFIGDKVVRVKVFNDAGTTSPNCSLRLPGYPVWSVSSSLAYGGPNYQTRLRLPTDGAIRHPGRKPKRQSSKIVPEDAPSSSTRFKKPPHATFCPILWHRSQARKAYSEADSHSVILTWPRVR